MDEAAAPAECVEGAPTAAGAVILDRSVSGRPGADGAPLDGCGRQISIPSVFVVVLVVLVRGAGVGAMRRDWVGVVVSWVWIDGWMDG